MDLQQTRYIAQEENEFRKLYDVFLRNKGLFIISILVCLSIAFVINKYTPRIYKVGSKVLIQIGEDNRFGGNMPTDRLAISSFVPNYSFQNEVLMLQNSSGIASQLVYELDLSVNYYQKERWKYREIYKAAPFRISYPKSKPQAIGILFELEAINGQQFKIIAKSNDYYTFNYEKNEPVEFGKEIKETSIIGRFGELIEHPDFSFIVSKDTVNDYGFSGVYAFEFINTVELAPSIIGSVGIELLDEEGTAVDITLESPCPEKAQDILNLFIKLYQDYSLSKKNYIADQTIGYIDKQLNVVSDSLQATDRQLQNFRISNQVIDLESRTTSFTTQLQALETRRSELASQKKYYEYVLDYLGKEDLSNMVIPSSMGIEDQSLNTYMNQVIEAQSQKNALLANNLEKNPNIKQLDQKIENYKKAIIQNINYVLKTTEIAIEDLDKRLGQVQREFEKLPRTESRLAGIERKYNISNEIYTYLLQRRTEANIAKASNRPDSEVLEPAQNRGKVYPNTKMNLVTGGFIGLLIPIIFLFFRNIVNNRIKTEDNIEQLTHIPVLGKILHNHRETTNVVLEMPNSTVSESFRTLRTNLDFYLKDKSKKVIMITSSIEGEGKSFTAQNLAMCYAQLKRKTILLDFDLRKPGTYFENKNLIGLSTYLVNKCTLDDIITHSPHEKLHYITSGPVPPNPIELMSLEKMDNLFNLLKNNYEYIFIDTSPLAQVSDAYLLNKHIDFIALIARINYVDRGIFAHVVKDLQRKEIQNCCIVMNDNRHYRDQYGYGYGYQKKRFKIFRKK